MGERRQKAVPVWVTKTCDVCGSDMEFTGSMAPNVIEGQHDLMFPHICQKEGCNHTETFDQPYPAVLYAKGVVVE